VVRKAVSGLTALGLIGGAGSVVYNSHGDATVKIKDASGHVQTVQISANHAKAFSCPTGTHDKVAPLDIKLGRIKLTQQSVKRSELAIEHKYPVNSTPPRAVLVRYKALLRQDDRLTAAYNATVDKHNAIIDKLCTPE
jgi:hypothetical protein